jgi:cobalt-zinc-cadmium efflux system membrane fusion protein
MITKAKHNILWIGSLLGTVGLVVLSVAEIRSGSSSDSNGDSSPGAYRLVAGDMIEADNDAVKTAGVRTIAVEPRDLPVTLSLTGRTGLDLENVTHVHAQFGGKVKQVKPELGARVNGPEAPGGPTVLCIIESNDLAQAKSGYLQAKVQLKLDEDNLERTKELVKSTVLADKFLLDAESAVKKDEAALEGARQQLLVFGLDQNDIDQIDAQQGRQRMDYIITSPRSGVIAEKGVSGGEVADPTVNLFTVADTSTMWVWGDVYERDLRRIKVGDPMKVIFASDPDQPRSCKIDWISPVLDPNTHSVRIRGSLENDGGQLLADMYGTMLVTVDAGKDSIVIPSECVVRKGKDAFVFEQVAGGDASTTRYKRLPVKVESVDVGFGISESAAAIASAKREPNQAAATDESSMRPVRVVDGLKPGQAIVQSGALGLFNEMEQQAQ